MYIILYGCVMIVVHIELVMMASCYICYVNIDMQNHTYAIIPCRAREMSALLSRVLSKAIGFANGREKRISADPIIYLT